MTRRSCWGLLALATTTSLGCAMCASPFDYDYAAFGGIRPRSEMRYGRVGSVLDESSSSQVPFEYASGEPEFFETEVPYQQSPQLDDGVPVEPGPSLPSLPRALDTPPDSVIQAPRIVEPPPVRRPPVEAVPSERGPRRPADDDLELPEI